MRQTGLFPWIFLCHCYFFGEVVARNSAFGLGGLPLRAWSQPWRLAAFDVGIRTPLPSSLHPSVLCLFPSTPWRWRSPSCFTLHSPDPALYARPPDSPPTPSQSALPLPVPPDHLFQPSILPSSHSRLRSLQFLPSTFDSTCHIMRWHSLSSTP
jgi:hypothetical protein